MDEHKRALVVGINAYGGGIPRLGSAVRDAEAVANHLELAHGYEVKLLRDAEAAAKTITASLAEVVGAGLSEDSSFVFYYAGHGVADDDREGAGPQGFLLPYDAHLTNKDTWLGMQSLQGALDGLQCRHLMLVLDCCYAGAFQWVSTRSVGNVKRPLYQSQYERYREGKAWQVLTSASYDETADDAAPVTADRGGTETPEGHSPFAQALIEALSGSAADSSRGGMAADGVITATELYQFIYERVVVNDRQTPGIFPLKPDNKGEFVFLAPGIELNLEPDPPLDDANNPWLGLEAYTPADHHVFFGREEATKELLGRVEAHRFVAVVGASGSGKSSLIRAGVLPALEAPAWVVAESARLAADLGAALKDAQMQLTAAPASERRLLVIDQFEDLFRHADDAARARFLDDLRHLVEAEDGPTVLIGLRSDFEPRAADELGALWTGQARYPVPDFSPDDLRAVILGPAQAKAVFFEPAKIVDDLVHEVVRMPGAPPLLSLTLSSLYRQAQERRRANDTADRMISLDDYKAVGGAIGVLHRHANKLYDATDAAGQETIRRILLRLVDQKPDGLTRRNVDRDELRFGPEHDQVVSSTLDDLTAARLLVVGNQDGRDYVEPAHDALVSTWDKQLSWLAQSGSQEVVRDASKAARDWSVKDGRSNRSKRLWNQDPRLAELERRDRNHELNALEQDFRSVSSTRRRRLARIRRLAITALIALTVVAIVTGVYARIKQTEAVREAERASSRALASDALNNAETETDLAALLALESVRVANTADARGSLAGVLSLPTRFLQRTDVHDSEITAIGFGESGLTAATGDASGIVMLWDVNEDPFPSPPSTQATLLGAVDLDLDLEVAIREVFVTDDPENPVLAFDTVGLAYLVDFTTEDVAVLDPPDEFVEATVNEGVTVFAGITADGALHVYDIDDEFNFVAGPTTSIDPTDMTDLTVSPDGTRVAWGEGSELSVWSSLDGATPQRVDLEDRLTPANIAAISFSPDRDPGKAVIGVGMEDGTVIVVDRNDPSLFEQVDPAPVNQLFDLAFKPDSNDDGAGDVTYTLASTHSNGDVNLFEVVPGGEGFKPFGFLVETMLGHNDEAKEVAFAPDGRVASGDFSGELLWWLDVPLSSLGVPWLDHGAQMYDAAFASSNRIVSRGGFFAAWLSELDSSETLEIVEDSRVYSVDAAGDVIAVGLEGPTLILGQDGNTLRTLDSDQGLFVEFVALSSDGRQLATVSPRGGDSYSGVVDIWDVETGTLSHGVELPDEFEPYSTLFADDGAIWIGGRGRNDLPTVFEIEATTGAVLGEIQHSSRSGNAVTALAISDDGRTLATGAMDRRISLWDTGTRTARPGGEFTGHRGNVTGIVFWDGGDTLISSDDAGDILLWDVSDRRQFARLGGPTDDVTSLEVDADSATLLATSEDGYVWTWSLDPELWRHLACQLAGRNMTQAEWELYGGGGTRVRHCVGFPAEDGEVRDADYSESLTD